MDFETTPVLQQIQVRFMDDSDQQTPNQKNFQGTMKQDSFKGEGVPKLNIIKTTNGASEAINQQTLTKSQENQEEGKRSSYVSLESLDSDKEKSKKSQLISDDEESVHTIKDPTDEQPSQQSIKRLATTETNNTVQAPSNYHSSTLTVNTASPFRKFPSQAPKRLEANIDKEVPAISVNLM